VSPQPIAAAAGTFTLGGDLTVNRMGFGAMRVTGPGVWEDPPDRGAALAVLRRAVELGVNLIDTADSYGPFVSEDLIAEALRPYPADLVIATKGGLTRTGPEQWHPVGRPEYLIQCVEMSLRRLKLERIDLYQFHEIDAQVPLEESLGALTAMQDQGKIRHIGVSNFNADELARARAIARVVSVQNEYNLIDRRSEQVVAVCERDGLGFLPWAPVADGRLARPGGVLDRAAARHGATVAQISLAWLLHRSPVMLPIPGTSRIDHLEDNAAAAALQLSDEEWAAVEGAAPARISD
jgi:aryl-alcohol dehydrogenase-like predicted oxidoreductase